MKMPVSILNRITSSATYDGKHIDRAILDSYGIFVLRKAISIEIILKYRGYYEEYKKSSAFDRTKGHLTEVRLADDNPLLEILKEKEFRKIGAEIFPDGVGIYNIRIVKKDADDISPVFLHQDVGYQYGSFNRYSFFIPLSRCSKENGGLSFVPGTHNFGYLGDVGSIKESLIPNDLNIITPTVDLGDIVMMNSYVWHKSGKNEENTDRIYYDIHLNPSADPASKYILNDRDDREYALNYDKDVLFENSRLQRLEKFTKKYGAI